jgi:hypothetical protein
MDGLAVQQKLIRRNFSIPIISMTEIGSIRNSLSAVQSLLALIGFGGMIKDRLATEDTFPYLGIDVVI